jgi:hypothetical protein
VRPSPALVRRLDRLGRRAHAFHRFAHHPLCDNYAGELIALRGRTRVCRGCTTALGCALLGALAALSLRLPVWQLTTACAAAQLALLFAPRAAASVIARPAAASVIAQPAAASVIAQPAAALGWARPSKLWTRGLPAFLYTASIFSLLRAPTLAHIAAASALLALGWHWLARYRRRGPDRSPCSACPELNAAAPCSGFRSIVRAERAFVRRSERLLDAAVDREGFAP